MAVILDMPCQDDAATATVDDLSAFNNDGSFTVGNSEDYSIAATGALAKAFDGTAMQTNEAVLIPTFGDFFVILVNGGGRFRFRAKRNDKTQIDTIAGSNQDPPSTISFLNDSDVLVLHDESATELTINTGVDTSAAHLYELNLKSDASVELYVDDALVGTMSGSRTDDVFLNLIGFSLTYFTYFNGWFNGFWADNTSRPFAPTITSSDTAAVEEGETAVKTVTATGSPAPTFSIIGGTDASFFSIVEATGVLTFDDAPDYETPADGNADNIYSVTVRATNTENHDDQTIAVTVTNDAGDDPSAGGPRNNRLSLGIGVGL